MAWLPPPGGRLLDAAARRAAEAQRGTYLHMLGLRVRDVLQPLEGPAISKKDVARIKLRIGTEADAMRAAHEGSLPDCHRAPFHLQMASLALASQRVLRDEARRDDFLLCSALKVRTVVANALGVVAPPDGSPPREVGGLWLPNKLALLFTGALLLPERRLPIVERMMHNLEVDLGAGFCLEPLEPHPSRVMTRCFYAAFLEAEAETACDAAAASDARVLVPIFQAMHASTFCGVPGFVFESHESGHGGAFRFEFRAAAAH